MSTSVHSETFSVTNAAELRGALQAAQNNGTLDTILLAPGTYSTDGQGPFRFDSPDGQDLTLVGREADPASVVISGAVGDEVLVLHNQQPGGTFTLRGLTIVGGSQAFQTSNASTHIEYCAFSGPTVPTSPGGPATAPPAGEEVTIMSSVFMGADEPATTEGISAAAHTGQGWMLLGTSRSINNMNLFNSFRAVWAYQDGQWKAYSSDPDIRDRIKSRNIKELKRLPPYSGFWVWRR